MDIAELGKRRVIARWSASGSAFGKPLADSEGQPRRRETVAPTPRRVSLVESSLLLIIPF